MSTARPRPDAVLEIQVRGDRREHVLRADELVTIGRSSGCGIQINDKSVSREHCVAILTNGVVCVNDLRSTHGIKHHGERVDRAELRPGDSCHVGNAVLTFAPHDAPNDAPRRRAPAVVPTAPATPPTPAAPVEFEDEVVPAAPAAKGPKEPLPDRVGNYRIIDKLGEGGFGVVYRAEQEPLGREVALKVMKRGAGELQERVDAFVAEARAAARVADPHLVQVFEIGEADGSHYLSMEYVGGGSLARRIRSDGPMPWEQVLDLLHDMGEALAAAHRAGIVHRDVKPANILLMRDGVAKLADLGMATGIGLGGTVAFMAPEQLRKQPADARSDLYSLGVTAYAALTGSPPFNGEKADIARAHVREQPPPLQERNVQAPWHLQQLIVESLLAKDPEDRPQSAEVLLERLDRLILPGAPLPAAGVEPVRRVSRAMQQKRFAARLTAEAITVGIISALLIIVLLLLKVLADVDIYRLIGR